jgi:hypothetical protein
MLAVEQVADVGERTHPSAATSWAEPARRVERARTVASRPSGSVRPAPSDTLCSSGRSAYLEVKPSESSAVKRSHAACALQRTPSSVTSASASRPWKRASPTLRVR